MKKLKTLIAAMAVFAVASCSLTPAYAQVTRNVPLRCFQNVDLVAEYKSKGVFEPFMLAENNDAMLAIFMDPKDREIHLWLVSGNTVCLVDKTRLTAINQTLLVPKPNL